MDPDLLLIFSFIIVITAVIGFSVNGIVAKSLDYKRSIRAAKTGPAPEELSEIKERTAMIEDRLQVLERIATDPEARNSKALADEIEQLRVTQEKTQ